MKRAVLLLVLLLAACGAAPPSGTSVELREFVIATEAPRLRSGEVILEVANAGSFPHTLVVSDADGMVVDATEPLAGGEGTALVLDLSPGRYQLTCRIVAQIPDGSIVDHYERGMAAEVVVTEA